MGQKFSLLVAFLLGAAALSTAQTAAPGQAAPASLPSAAQRAVQAPTDSDIYCAGYFTHRSVEPSLFVLGSEDGAVKFEFGSRDVIYLSKGRKGISAPGGQYMLVRPIKYINPTESYPGQHALVSRMGTLYADIARIEIQILHEETATAQILHACEPVLEGDIAIPLATRPAPHFKSTMFTERFAPSSGKATGMIAAIKEFQEAAGRGHIVYLNVGNMQGAQAGSYLRIFRTYLSPSQYLVQQGARNYLTEVMGVPVGRKLTQEEIESLPRTVLGEVMILSAEDESSTGIITYSMQDIYPGDQVEVE